MNLNSFSAIQTNYTKCYNNGCTLLNDALLLFEHERYPRAYLLSHIAIEEFSRCIMLSSAMMKFRIRSLDVKKLIERQTKHHSKIELGYSFVEKIKNYNSPLNKGDFMEIIVSMLLSPQIIDDKTIQQLNKLKNSSLYVDQHNNLIKEPSEIITFEEANNIIKSATILKEFIEFCKWHEEDNLIKLLKKIEDKDLIKIKNNIFGKQKKI